MAIGEGFRQIRDDYADVMICSGVEAPLNQLCFGAFAIIRAMSTRNEAPRRASRPFDQNRDGFVMGEGAAVVVLEEYERAKSRGAHIYAEVSGASGAMEAAICALSLERGWLPATLNLDQPGDACDLDHIRGSGRATSVDYMLSNSFGFGGINAALVIKRAG